MRWFHTVALPIATLLAVYFRVQKKAPFWKLVALVLGCGIMLAGLWLEAWSTFLLIGGGLVFFFGLSRDPETPQTSPRAADARAVAAGEPEDGGLHISFPSPGFFLGDARVVLLLDGTSIYTGGFKAGIDLPTPAVPGPHRLESVIELGIAKRRQSWDVEVPTTGCDITLEYSRLWGNFARRARIVSLPSSR